MSLRRSSLFAAAIAAVTLVAAPAWAIKDPETGLTFPNTSKCGGAPSKAVGVGVREATFGIDVYAVVVYAAAGAMGKSLRSTNACVKITMKFVRSVGAGKIKTAWRKGLTKNGASGAPVTQLLSIVTSEIKKAQYMIVEVNGAKVSYRYAGRSVTVSSGALGRAVKKLYLGGSSPTPELVKSVRKMGLAKP